MTDIIIFGCGDIGTRVANQLESHGAHVVGVVRSDESASMLGAAGISPRIVDLDDPKAGIPNCSGKRVFYFMPPPIDGERDARSSRVIDALAEKLPDRVVLISTTGVYGDCAGDWVDEGREISPSTGRAKRRADAESQWLEWARCAHVALTILRVPGIYSRSRIPRDRLLSGEPIVNPDECGWTNRIHADDLAIVCVRAMERAAGYSLYNVSDGTPGTISEYLLAAARELGLSPPPLVSLAVAGEKLSPTMLSYLSESRRIDNSRMSRELEISLKYPDFREGLKH